MNITASKSKTTESFVVVACFALRQNIASDRLLTIADKRVGAAQSYSRYCSSRSAVTAYAALFVLFCIEAYRVLSG